MEVEPLVEDNYCKVCQTIIHTNHAEPHIAVKHQDIIKQTALEIEKKIKEEILRKKKLASSVRSA